MSVQKKGAPRATQTINRCSDFIIRSQFRLLMPSDSVFPQVSNISFSMSRTAQQKSTSTEQLINKYESASQRAELDTAKPTLEKRAPEDSVSSVWALKWVAWTPCKCSFPCSRERMRSNSSQVAVVKALPALVKGMGGLRDILTKIVRPRFERYAAQTSINSRECLFTLPPLPLLPDGDNKALLRAYLKKAMVFRLRSDPMIHRNQKNSSSLSVGHTTCEFTNCRIGRVETYVCHEESIVFGNCMDKRRASGKESCP